MVSNLRFVLFAMNLEPNIAGARWWSLIPQCPALITVSASEHPRPTSPRSWWCRETVYSSQELIGRSTFKLGYWFLHFAYQHSSISPNSPRTLTSTWGRYHWPLQNCSRSRAKIKNKEKYVVSHLYSTMRMTRSRNTKLLMSIVNRRRWHLEMIRSARHVIWLDDIYCALSRIPKTLQRSTTQRMELTFRLAIATSQAQYARYTINEHF